MVKIISCLILSRTIFYSVMKCNVPGNAYTETLFECIEHRTDNNIIIQLQYPLSIKTTLCRKKFICMASKNYFRGTDNSLTKS